MTGLSEQAKELHMMMGRRKPPKIQAVLNTRYWKNTEKNDKKNCRYEYSYAQSVVWRTI